MHCGIVYMQFSETIMYKNALPTLAEQMFIQF